ncbi:MAG: hypothetical protein IJT62_04935 [Oscillospiraceae bacterium]|nr:hypothetical protein [Oscillospiraceae bacterium]
MTKNTKALTRSALCAAVCAVLLYLGALLPTMKLALLCVASVAVAFIRMNCGWKWALLCYASASVVSLVLLPQKALAILFAVFFGHYPVWMLSTERISSRIGRYALRLGVFLVLMCALYFLYGAVFGQLLPGFVGTPLILLAAGIAGFLIYDQALRMMILYYLHHVSGRI